MSDGGKISILLSEAVKGRWVGKHERQRRCIEFDEEKKGMGGEKRLKPAIMNHFYT